MSGTAHSIVHRHLLESLLTHEQIEFLSCKEWDGEHLFYVEITSPNLKPGYHGVVDIITEYKDLTFKGDRDV